MLRYEKTGHKKDGYSVVKVYEDNSGETPNFIGYRIIGPNGYESEIFTDIDAALEELERLAPTIEFPDSGPSGP